MKLLNILENNIGVLFHMHEKSYVIYPSESWEFDYETNYTYYGIKKFTNTQQIKTPYLFLDLKIDHTWKYRNIPMYKIKFLYEGNIGVSWLSLEEIKNCEVVLPTQIT